MSTTAADPATPARSDATGVTAPSDTASVSDVSEASASTPGRKRGTSIRRLLGRSKNQVKVISSSKSPIRPKKEEQAPTTMSAKPESAEEITAALAFETPTASADEPADDDKKTEDKESAPAEAEPAPASETQYHHDGGSWLTRTRAFKSMCKHAFQLIDTDESGDVDEKELYSGLLLIHLKLGMYAGPAACRPLGRERCHKIFQKFDREKNGTLNRHEFEGVMKILFSNVLFRVLVQWSMTIIIVPIVAKFVLETFYDAVELVYWLITNADEYFSVANAIELTIEGAVAWVWERTPPMIVAAVEKIVEWWNAVPDSVWNAAPLALISTVLGILVVPWIIIKVDDFFQWLAMRAETDDHVPDSALAAAKQAAASEKESKPEESSPSSELESKKDV